MLTALGRSDHGEDGMRGCLDGLGMPYPDPGKPWGVEGL